MKVKLCGLLLQRFHDGQKARPRLLVDLLGFQWLKPLSPGPPAGPASREPPSHPTSPGFFLVSISPSRACGRGVREGSRGRDLCWDGRAILTAALRTQPETSRIPIPRPPTPARLLPWDLCSAWHPLPRPSFRSLHKGPLPMRPCLVLYLISARCHTPRVLSPLF